MNQIPCTHPARVTGEDGKVRCLCCGEVVKPEKPEKKAGKDEQDKEGNRQ